MSFFSSPAQYLREALEARRERQREEKEALRKAAKKKPFFGNRRNLHDHRPIQEPIFHENEQADYHEDFYDEDPTPSPSSDNFKWRSISNFVPNFLLSKELEDEERKIQDEKIREPLAIMGKGEVASGGNNVEEVKSIGDDEDDDKALPGMKSHLVDGELGLANDGDSEEIALRRTLDRRDIGN
jgi:hypothetical protein